MILIACDLNTCDQTHEEGSPQLLTWLAIETLDPDDDAILHFCTRDHLIQKLAAFEIPDTIPADPSQS